MPKAKSIAKRRAPARKKTLEDLARPHEPMVSSRLLCGNEVPAFLRLKPQPTNAADLLAEASTLIGKRGAERDQPNGERSMARCVNAFNAMTGHALTERDGWQFMELLKMARTRGGRYKLDDYLDGAAYCALAGEAAQGEGT